MTTYLLDVSVLVALGFKEHEFFERVVSWVEGLSRVFLPKMLNTKNLRQFKWRGVTRRRRGKDAAGRNGGFERDI